MVQHQIHILMITILQCTVVLACSALLCAHIAAFHIYVDYKLDQLIKRRYLVERSGNLDKLAALNDRIQRWVRIRDIIKL